MPDDKNPLLSTSSPHTNHTLSHILSCPGIVSTTILTENLAVSCRFISCRINCLEINARLLGLMC